MADRARAVTRRIPAYNATLETATGWAFFNVNGYLGTVTEDGGVVFEDEYLEDE